MALDPEDNPSTLTIEPQYGLQLLATSVQVVSVVAGVLVSVLSFNATRRKEAEARRLELAKPFLQLRQSLYLEAVKCAGVLTNPTVHSQDEIDLARKRFRALYVAELSMVEASEVEREMIAFAHAVDPEIATLTIEQKAAYVLSHALRDSFLHSWGLDAKTSTTGPVGV